MCKKLIAIGLVFLITMGGVITTAADSISAAAIGIIGGATSSANAAATEQAIDTKNAKITKEEAKKISLELLKKNFGIEIDEKKYQGNAQLSPGYEIGKGYIWQFTWSMSNNIMFTHISTEIDAVTGKLIGFSKSESYRNQEQVIIANITKEQARKTAEELIKKINPEEFKQVKLEDNRNEILYSSRTRPNYNFQYTREINGLSYPGNYIMLGVNGSSGSIENYRISWQYDIKLPEVKSILEKEKALKILKDKFDMELCYMPVRIRTMRYIEPAELKLAYMPNLANGVSIDAQTGDVLGYDGQKVADAIKRDITKEQKDKMTAAKSVQTGKTEEMSSEQAEVFINKLIKEFFGTGYKAGNLNYSENEMGMADGSRKTWNAEVMEDKPDAYEGKGNIAIDSASGEIFSIGRYVFEDWYGKEYERKITWEQAYDKAVEVLGQYYPHRLGEVITEQVNRENPYTVNGKLLPERMIYFGFPRVINGVKYGNNSVNISIDTKTGEVNDVNSQWSEGISFPDTAGIMAKEKAKELFFKEYDIKLIYLQYNKKVNQNEYTPGYKIAYTLEQKKNGNMSIDAFSGKLLNFDGYELGTEESDFSEKIKGNPAEKELSILAFQNIIDTRSFSSDKDITYMELLKMLVNAKGYRPYMARDQLELKFKNIDKKSENYPYLLEAVRYGVIENKPVELKLDAKVTREQMAECIVKLLKYEKLAKAKNIFMSDYKDSNEINADLKGHVAIVKGLGIIEGTSGMFKPKENLKMQEAALIIYRALDSIKN